MEKGLQAAPTLLSFIPKVGKYLASGAAEINTYRAVKK
jgi:hypothetical protein